VKLLLDEQISGKVAERLRRRGLDTIAVSADPAIRGMTDPELFALAQEQGRTVVTYNRADFEAIVREYASAGTEHHGLLIVSPARFSSWEFSRLVEAVVAQVAGLSSRGNFVAWLDEPR